MTIEERIKKLEKRKLDYDLKSAQWLMKANDIDERISKLKTIAKASEVK